MSIETISRPSVALTEHALQEANAWLTEQLAPHAFYHDEKHLEQLLDAASELADEVGLEPRTAEQLKLAVIFQAIGRAQGGQPWESGGKAASDFLLRNGADMETVNAVADLLHALDPKHQPDSVLEKLFLDVVHSDFGKKKLLERADLLRMEEEAISQKPIGEAEWAEQLLARMQAHAFHTPEAGALFGKRKEKNMQKLTKSLQLSRKEKLADDKNTSVSANSGARTMFKVALRNHIDLTSIADNKANMMLSINALIITIGLPAFSTYLYDKPTLMAPAVIFLLTSVATMIVATLSTRPIRVDGQTDLAKLKSGKANLFFFGNFYKIPNGQYHDAIKEVVADRDYLDASFVNDLYYLGISLGDKFRMLRLCYNIFVVGLCLSVLSFVVAYFLMGK